MSGLTPDTAGRGIGTRRIELLVAGGFVLLAAVVAFDSVRIGHGWGADGPEAGFYPFYVNRRDPESVSLLAEAGGLSDAEFVRRFAPLVKA